MNTCARLVALAVALTWCLPALSKDKPYEANGAHRMVEVAYLPALSDISEGEGRWIYESLLRDGIDAADIGDSSIAVGRIYCCRPNPVDDPSFLFYTPPDMPLQIGDRVEIRIPGRPKKGRPVSLSRTVRIWESGESVGSECIWDPEIEGNWLRVLKCDFMEAEGWVYQKGLYKTWYKPAGRDQDDD